MSQTVWPNSDKNDLSTILSRTHLSSVPAWLCPTNASPSCDAAITCGASTGSLSIRGRFSEGMSLSDHAVRGVVCVGIPLPPLLPAVRLKRDYNDVLARAPSRTTYQLDGEAWYNLGAYRAVNQALGRVIRHRQDYGAAVLIDARWTAKGSMRAVRYLPLWLRRLMGIRDSWLGESLSAPVERVVADLQRHFRSFPAWQPPAVPQSAARDDVELTSQPETTPRRVRPRLELSGA